MLLIAHSTTRHINLGFFKLPHCEMTERKTPAAQGRKLGTGSESIERVSDLFARCLTGSGHISGDSLLSAGRHAWKIAYERGFDFVATGIVEVGKELPSSSYQDGSFYGIGTDGKAYLAGKLNILLVRSTATSFPVGLSVPVGL